MVQKIHIAYKLYYCCYYVHIHIHTERELPLLCKNKGQNPLFADPPHTSPMTLSKLLKLSFIIFCFLKLQLNGK